MHVTPYVTLGCFACHPVRTVWDEFIRETSAVCPSALLGLNKAAVNEGFDMAHGGSLGATHPFADAFIADTTRAVRFRLEPNEVIRSEDRRAMCGENVAGWINQGAHWLRSGVIRDTRIGRTSPRLKVDRL